MSKFDDLIKALEDLTTAVKDQSNSASGSDPREEIENKLVRLAAVSNLANQIGNLGNGIIRLLDPVTKMEQSLASVGIKFEEGYKSLISGTLPLSTRMQATTALVEAGLERNSAVLGQSVARSAVLGENIQMLTASFRDLKVVLNLNRTELDSMSQVIERSAYNYKTSTTELTREIATLSRQMAVLGMSGAMKSNEAIVEAIAMTQRATPGVLQEVLGELVSGGTGGLGTSLMRGLEDLASRLVSNQITSPEQIFAPLDQMIKNIEATLGPITGENFRVQTDLLQGLYGFSFEQVMSIKSMLENTTVISGEQKSLVQRSDEINKLLSNLGPKLLEPLAAIAVRVLKLIDQNAEYFSSFFSILVGSAFASKVFSSLAGIAASITALRIGQAGAGIPIIGGLISLAAGAAAYSFITKELEDSQRATQSNTELTARELAEMNERERRRDAAQALLSPQRILQEMAIGSVGRILAATQGSGLLDQSAQQTRLTVELVEEMKKVNGHFEDITRRTDQTLPPPSPSRVMRHN